MNTHCAVYVYTYTHSNTHTHLCIEMLHDLPGLCGLLRCVCGGDGSYLLSISQQRSIGRFWKENNTEKLNKKKQTTKLK